MEEKGGRSMLVRGWGVAGTFGDLSRLLGGCDRSPWLSAGWMGSARNRMVRCSAGDHGSKRPASRARTWTKAWVQRRNGLKRYINPQCSAEDVSAHTRPTAFFTLHPHASAEAPPKPTMAPVAPGTEALRREGAGLVVDLAKDRAAGSAPSGCLRWFGHVHACGARESG